MPRNQRRNQVYGVGDDILNLPPTPIIAQRAPTVRDRMEIGTIWIDQPNDDSYILTSIVASNATWINAGGGTGTFNALTVTTTATIGTTLLVGGVVTLSNLGTGVVQSGATGILTSSAGTDGQLLVADTGGSPVWAAITSATLVITPGAGTLNIEESGGTANSYVTDLGGPVAPLVGVLDVLGGTNVTTDGTVANTITIDLDDDVTLAGFLSVADDITMLGGDLTITADTDAAQTIYLHANGGTNETIDIHSDQGTGVSAIDIHADVGGIDIDSGLSTADAINIVASDAAGGIDIDAGTSGIAADTTGSISFDAAAPSNFTTTGASNDITILATAGSVIVQGGEAVADAIVLNASNAAGGLDVDAGTGGMSFVTGNGIIAFESGTADINIGVDAAVHTVTVGSVTGAADTVIQSGTGDLSLTSTDAITIDSTGVLELNSSGGIISIGNDAVAQNINIGDGAAARAITIGNGTGATSVVVDSGTGPINIGVNAVAHDITIGNITGTTAVDINAGSAGTTITATDGTIALVSGTGAINLGTDAAAHTVTLGTNNTTADTYIQSGTGGIDMNTYTGDFDLNTGGGAISMNSGTGAFDIGTDATAHILTLGSVNTTSQTIVQSGTGDLVMTSTDAITADAAGVLELNSSAGAISIGNDVVAQAINIGTGGDRTMIIGSGTGANSVTVECGTAGCNFGVTANAHTTTLGSTTTTSQTILQSGTGDLVLTSTDAVTIDGAGVIEINSSAGVIGIGNDAVAQDINIATGAGARTLTMGNGTGASSVVMDCGTGGISIGETANAHNVTVGSTSSTSDVLVQSGTGGITLSAAGNVDVVPVTNSVAGVALTLNGRVGQATFTGQTTGAAASVTFTITNSSVTTSNMMLLSLSNGGANDAQMTISRIEQLAGSIEVIATNNGAAALNGDVMISFWVMN